MAKEVTKGIMQVEMDWKAGTSRLRFFSYDQPTDDTDAERIYKNTGTQVADPAPRDLTAGELSGTVTALVAAMKAAAETAEGISA